jgi:hypothetical protein
MVDKRPMRSDDLQVSLPYPLSNYVLNSILHEAEPTSLDSTSLFMHSRIWLLSLALCGASCVSLNDCISGSACLG